MPKIIWIVFVCIVIAEILTEAIVGYMGYVNSWLMRVGIALFVGSMVYNVNWLRKRKKFL